MSDSWQPHGLQHTRLPCPPSSPEAYSHPYPLSQWCHPNISSSVIPFSSCLQSFPVSGSFLMSWFFASGGQSIGASVSAAVLSMNIQDWFPLGLTGLISLESKGLQESSPTHSSKSILWHSAFFMVQLSHPYRTTGKVITLTMQTFVDKVMSLFFNVLFRLVIAFPPRTKCLFISCFQSPSTMILEPKKIKSVTVSIVSPSIYYEVILEWEVKWVLGSITMSKASGDDGISAELFQILKEDAVKVLHSICQQIWKTQQWPQDRKRSVFIPIPKKGNECSNQRTIPLISHASKVMFKILQARRQQYLNLGPPDVQVGFRTSLGTRDQIANIHWIIDKAR